MVNTTKPQKRAALLCVCAFLTALTAAAAPVKVGKLIAPPSLPSVRRAVPTLDRGDRTVRETRAGGVQDHFPDGGAPASAVSPCVPSAGSGNVLFRESVGTDRRVDACGQLIVAGRSAPKLPTASGASIDRMTTAFWYSQTHSGGGTLQLLGPADTYFLSDGSSWRSGAGSYSQKSAYLDHVEVNGNTVRYVLSAPIDGMLYQQTDYDSGEHSAQGTLGAAGALVLEATIGSTTATLRGSATILSNDATYYGDRFNYYSAIPGSTVPFESTYTLIGATWQPGTFDTDFYYACTGSVDFAHPTATPALEALEVRGSSQVPSNAVVPYAAIARFVNGVERDVARLSAWQADPASVAQVAAGVLSTGTFQFDRQPVTIRATYATGGSTVEGVKTVLGRLAGTVGDPDTWPTFQADERHTGYLARRYDPESFTLRWTKAIPPGYPLNPVTSAEGRVFVSTTSYFGSGPSLFALDARDGEMLWSQEFGDVFSVNPPAWGYGNVYLQTCNHSGNTWLHAFDAETGGRVFKAPLEAQWERYYAPTIIDGTVYVDGGYYGGMYAVNAFSGDRLWFTGLPQYDEWTPGVKGDSAYAYVGEYAPGLYVLDRHTGQQRAFIEDPDFDWNGWSMNLAPVVLENGDVLAIHNNRLIRFDVQGRRIAWQRSSVFSGQPSYANGVIYAVDSFRLVALNPGTGAELWSWAPPNGTAPRSPLIVTDSHVFVSTENEVYAVDLGSRVSSWSYPAGGKLALGDENLYVAQQDGTLVAIAATPFSPSPPVSLEIRGPDQAAEFTSVQYRLFVQYADGRVRERTRAAAWKINPATYASIDDAGIVSVSEMLDLSQLVTITAQYTEAGGTLTATKPIHLQSSLTLPQLIERNRSEASAIQHEVIAQLDRALAREHAILRALGVPEVPGSPVPPEPFVASIVRAILAGDSAKASTQRAVDQLAIAGGTPLPLP